MVGHTETTELIADKRVTRTKLIQMGDQWKPANTKSGYYTLYDFCMAKSV